MPFLLFWVLFSGARSSVLFWKLRGRRAGESDHVLVRRPEGPLKALAHVGGYTKAHDERMAPFWPSVRVAGLARLELRCGATVLSLLELGRLLGISHASARRAAEHPKMGHVAYKTRQIINDLEIYNRGSRIGFKKGLGCGALHSV